jgi:signal transduction histidine kinase
MPGSEFLSQRWTLLARLALFAAVYAGAALLSTLLGFYPEHAAAMWLPSGVLVAALLLTRGRDWPWLALLAVLVGPFVSLDPGPPSQLSLLLFGGNALEGLTAAFLMRRVARLRPSLERVRDAAGLVLATAVSTGLAATVCVGFMVLEGRVTWGAYGRVWRVFWIGDAMGILVLAPLLLAWGARGLKGWSPGRRLEFAGLVLALGLFTHAVFQVGPAQAGAFPLQYAAFLFLPWAAMRFEARGASAATAVLSALALWHTLEGRGPFGAGSPFDSQRLAFLQSFVGSAGVCGLLLASAAAERRRVREEVLTLNLELRQSLETLARAQEQLVRRERLAALGELAATVAHEVRNPLGAIANSLVALRRLVRPEGEAPVGQLLGIIDEEVQRLDALVRGLLDFTRPVEPRRSPQPLEAVVEGALVSVLRAGPCAHVTVVRDLEPGPPPVPVDGQQLHVALSNLLTNALQAMPEGGTLTVRLRHGPGPTGACRAHLTISDTGRGIPPELQARIFEPFFTTRASGTGLGLAIVRRIVDAHQGEVEVRSAPGQGTTFTVHLPCGPEAAHAPALPPDEAREGPRRMGGA